MCSSIREKCLLSRNIHYELVTVMRSKEQIITAAMLLLITYTLSLSCISQAFPEGQESKTISSTGTIQIQTTTGIGIYHDYCSLCICTLRNRRRTAGSKMALDNLYTYPGRDMGNLD